MYSFRQHLIDNGLLHLEGEALQLERQTFKRDYSRRYMRQLRKSNKKIELLFTSEEFIQIGEKAQIFELSKTAFCKEVIYAALGHDFPLVNSKEIEILQLDIRKIGNLANQITRRVNSTRQVYPSDVREFNQRIYQLEQLVATRLGNPNLFRSDADQNM